MSTRDHNKLNQPGGVYYFTSTVMGWKQIFIKPIYIQMFIHSLKFFHEKRKVSTTGYCIMPNHIHWIFKLSDEDNNATKVIQTFKSYTAIQSIRLLKSELSQKAKDIEPIFVGKKSIVLESPNQLLPYFSSLASRIPDQNHRFWQIDSDLRYVLSENMLRQKLEYIHSNPTQTHWNLIDNPILYPYSSCRFYEKGVDWNSLIILNLF